MHRCKLSKNTALPGRFARRVIAIHWSNLSVKKPTALSPLLSAIALVAMAGPTIAQAQTHNVNVLDSNIGANTEYSIIMFPGQAKEVTYTTHQVGTVQNPQGTPLVTAPTGHARTKLPFANREIFKIHGYKIDDNNNKLEHTTNSMLTVDLTKPAAPLISYDPLNQTITARLNGEYDFKGLPWYCTDLGTTNELVRSAPTADPAPYDLDEITDFKALSSPLMDGQVIHCISTDDRGSPRNKSDITPFVLPVKLATAAATANGATTTIAGTGGSPGVDLQVLDAQGKVLGQTKVAADGSYTLDIPTPAATTQATVRAINLASHAKLAPTDAPYPQVFAVQTVAIGAAAATDAPVGSADSYSTPVNTALTTAAPGVLANDTAPAGKVLTAAVVTAPTNGTLVLAADGGFTYTPKDKFEGADSFTYIASYDSSKAARASSNAKAAPFVDSAPVTVTINVTAATTPPAGATAQGVPTLGHAGLVLLSGLVAGAAALRRRKPSAGGQSRQ